MISVRISGSSEQVDHALEAIKKILVVHGVSGRARPAPFVVRVDLTGTLLPLDKDARDRLKGTPR